MTVASTSDRQELNLVSFVSNALTALSQVAIVRRQDGAMGTGFLVGSDLLLTSAHVVGVEKRDSLIVTFDSAQNGGMGLGESCRVVDDVLMCSPVEALDFILLKLDRKVGLTRGWLRLSPDVPGYRDEVAIFGYMSSDQTSNVFELRLQCIPGRFLGTADSQIEYLAETRPGSGGSPVIKADGTVIGIHRGKRELLDRQKTGHGTSMIAILKELRKKIPDLVSGVDLEAYLNQKNTQSKRVFEARERLSLISKLQSLRESQFNQLLLLLDAGSSENDRCVAAVGESGAVGPRVNALMQWIGGPNRPTEDVVWDVLEIMLSPAPDTPVA